MGGRVLVGTLMAVDKHVNLVLCNTGEYRKYKVKGKPEGKELKRMLGFIVVRGVNVLYVHPEEAGKEDLVETDKPRKVKAAAKATPAPAAAPAKAGLPGLPGGLPAPGAAGLLGMRPGGLPGLPGMPAGGIGGLLGARPGLLPGLPGGLPGLPGGLPGLPGAPKAGGLLGLPMPGGLPGLPGMPKAP